MSDAIDKAWLDMPERGRDGLQARLDRLMRELRQPAFHDVDSVMNNPGWPDDAVPIPPILYFPELKAMRGRVSPEQAAWLEVLGMCTEVKPFVLKPDGYEEFREILYTSWRQRMEGGFNDPVTRLFDIMAEAKAKRRTDNKARRNGQPRLWTHKGRRNDGKTR